jgi:hypothetical protein
LVDAMENVMKKISVAGLVLGVILGVVAGLLSGSWFFWLGTGLAIGAIAGASHARRVQARDSYVKQGVNS